MYKSNIAFERSVNLDDDGFVMDKACSRFVTREGKVRSRGAISGGTAIKISVAHLQNATYTETRSALGTSPIV